MNRYKIGYTGNIYKAKRDIVFHPFTVEIGDFDLRTKAKNAF